METGDRLENESESKVEARVKYYDEILPIMLIDAKQDLSRIANKEDKRISDQMVHITN